MIFFFLLPRFKLLIKKKKINFFRWVKLTCSFFFFISYFHSTHSVCSDWSQSLRPAVPASVSNRDKHPAEDMFNPTNANMSRVCACTYDSVKVHVIYLLTSLRAKMSYILSV